ncbi:MAG TPA: molybdopterin-dependent oxidoreductase [Candidatus Sulfotelmatobacter sp.]|nr:molybdopterin-dependent oxidoreductase [Candidatus Sulfotelmatobacter sp.]
METDEKGKLSLDLKPGGYALFARLSGFKPLATHFEVRTTKELQTIPFILQLALNSGPVEVVPNTSTADLTLLAYPYHDATGLSLQQLKALPHTTVTINNPHTSADETYSGVRVADILTPLGAPLGKELHGIALTTYLVATGSDGYQAVLALAEVDPSFHPGEILVADTMNGKRLDEHSGPLKLVVTEDKRAARSVRNLTTIELKAAQ